MTNLIQGEITRISTALNLEKAAKLLDGEFEAILSSDTLDSHGEHIDVKGIIVPKDKTIRMYWNHDKWGTTLPLGTWPRIWKSAGALMGRGKVDLDDEFAVRVYNKIKAEIIDNVSIGLRPIEYDVNTQTWTKSELTEVSVVSEGANPDAVITNKSDFTEDDLKKRAESKGVAESPETPASNEAETTEQTADVARMSEIETSVDDVKNRLEAVEKALAAAKEDPSRSNLVSIRLAAKHVDKCAEKLNQTIKISLRKD